MTLAEQVRAAQLPPPVARRQIRCDARVSLAEMAAELDVSAVTVQRWEQGTFEPRRDKAIAYRNLLDALREASR
ncbi:helix-turn-helix transcriptional regulator [Blastococcus sp. KM273128]|uniref:helix-turn-helix domain-containing protein n=1 Tax=Blastococcus sp. KM273128 TaxID=2570314 RepID=UPI001F3BBB19|nr:helix-turn-helix transcriptional regulator [Blastococcus sp. KM273128]MCF6745107.1 helix-turn-helix transcriptional regulator [Blastococcus sp. KM273128]